MRQQARFAHVKHLSFKERKTYAQNVFCFGGVDSRIIHLYRLRTGGKHNHSKQTRQYG